MFHGVLKCIKKRGNEILYHIGPHKKVSKYVLYNTVKYGNKYFEYQKDGILIFFFLLIDTTSLKRHPQCTAAYA